MSVFHFILLTLASFRLQRLVTKDEWPPTETFREWVANRTGHGSSWVILFSCAWCFGLWTCGAVFAFDHFIWSPPDWLLGIFAASGIVGMLGTYDFRDED